MIKNNSIPTISWGGLDNLSTPSNKMPVKIATGDVMKNLISAIDDLKSINELDIRYLIVNIHLSFIDVSTLQMIEKKINEVIKKLEQD